LFEEWKQKDGQRCNSIGRFEKILKLKSFVTSSDANANGTTPANFEGLLP